MPLFIRDDEVAAMAEELARLTKTRSKTEAVRMALQHELDRTRAHVPLRDRLARIHEKAARIGLPNPTFDMKAYTDEMWGDT
ncbi:histidinol dehydrogenase [Paramesorhizobium deserti]|uniref:Histidinol dehydrogenase n=1 Tax=Paramesorhizobium deserti TaxID=1494590 RepID=A0A135I0G7_9HYPH|nr:type II toxin-antitoxin system VapB family antitoxin [Paramesorhizobium deserti]KXF78929.1 histidinol dehydrogenase [Paramesorhizobium deserti]